VTGSPPIAENTKAGGFWNDTVTSEDGQSGSRAIHAFITEDGRGYIELFDPFNNEYGLAGVVTEIAGTDGNIQIKFDAYSMNGPFLDGSTSTQGTITGTIVERSTFDGTWSLDSGESKDFSWIYETAEHWYEYDIGSSLATIAGAWQDQDGYPVAGAGAIDPDGSFFLQSEDGCVKSGEFSIIDPDYNAYAVTLNFATGCPEYAVGDYVGFAVLYDTWIDGAYYFDRLQLYMHGVNDTSLNWGSTTLERL
jgi:hypothetical protein